eukprot:SAG22_NODE_12642_length_435_cov_0.505952_1_plen_96_part_10
MQSHCRHHDRRRREQETEPGGARTPALRATPAASGSGAQIACAVTPCEMAGVCMNGGSCAPAAGVGAGGVGAFQCTCIGDYYGVRCAAVRECASGP